jgi:GNAT superfamily N-acetyltransferase
VRIRRVASRADRSSFLALPERLYADDPNWVPPLRSSVRALLDRSHHPFYAGGEGAHIELFLAEDDREVVGRVAAIHNHVSNRFHDENVVCFGFFEAVDRTDVAIGLLSAVETWASGRGARRVRGPMNPSTNYECGMLVDGFSRPPVLMMTYNPRYYPRLVERAGYRKAKDLLAYLSAVHGASLERLERLAERTRARNPGLVTRAADLKAFHSEVTAIQGIYNAAWERNWGFVPMSDGEIVALAKDLRPLVHPELLRFAEIDGEPAGFLLAVPDWNPVLRDLGGSIFRHPLRTVRHVLFTGPEDLQGLRLITLGVTEPHRKRGLEAVLFAEGIRAALELGYEWAEYSWILEDNELTKRAVRLMDGELYKTYRVYEKPL